MLTKIKDLKSPNFRTRLSAVASHMETVLDNVLPKPEGHQAVIMDAMRYSAMGGGKRLRPFLMVETAGLFDFETEALWYVAAALECIHVFSLIHDDLPCMDDDDLRRGKPTCHVAFDEAIAVLAGDALETIAFELIAQCDAPSDTRIRLITDLARASGVHGMIGGQVMDIKVTEEQRNEAIITQLQELKTGALITYAVRAGAIIAGALDSELKALTDYADDMGLAFQIKDDILDVEGDQNLIGKTVGKDENLGRATFVSILGLEGAKKRAAEMGERSKSHLEPFGEKSKILCDTVDFVLNRSH